MDISRWLLDLGLERYEAAFRENEIDETVLPNLTPADLKDLGITLVGHRRKLLDAIASLRSDPAMKSAASETLTTGSVPAKASAERRQVTVLFSEPSRFDGPFRPDG